MTHHDHQGASPEDLEANKELIRLEKAALLAARLEVRGTCFLCKRKRMLYEMDGWGQVCRDCFLESHWRCEMCGAYQSETGLWSPPAGPYEGRYICHFHYALGEVTNEGWLIGKVKES